MRFILYLSIVFFLFAVSCSSDDNPVEPDTSTLTLNIAGLENLGADARYEGWIIVNGAPVSTGLFDVDDTGNLSQTEFTVDATELAAATAFILTVEPSPDPDTAPSDVHILAGDFSGGASNLTVGHSAALGDDFTTAAGQAILATPTDAASDNETSGIWFLTPGTPPTAGLTLPTLPAGWTYEGWVVIDGTPVTTGTFLSVNGSDDSAPFSGPNAGPAYPGEDFLENAPAGLTFPTDLSNGTAVISIEPVPDNSPAPFVLKPLAGPIPGNTQSGTPITIPQNLGSFPTGSATR